MHKFWVMGTLMFYFYIILYILTCVVVLEYVNPWHFSYRWGVTLSPHSIFCCCCYFKFVPLGYFPQLCWVIIDK